MAEVNKYLYTIRLSIMFILVADEHLQSCAFHERITEWEWEKK